MRCRTLRGSPSRTARGQPLLPLWGQIWENICSDKESASPGRGQARAHQLLQPCDHGLLRTLLAPPPHPRLARPDTGVNGLETIWGLEGADVSCPEQEAFRPQPQTSRRPRHPIAPVMPTANATGTHCHPWVQKGLPWPCTQLPLTSKAINHQAGLETRACSGKKKGTLNFRTSGLPTATGPEHSGSRRPRQHGARTAVCSPGRASRAGGTGARR